VVIAKSSFIFLLFIISLHVKVKKLKTNCLPTQKPFKNPISKSKEGENKEGNKGLYACRKDG
jgi:hypothetical protein